MKTTALKTFLASLGLYCFCLSLANADDTEIYFGNNAVSVDTVHPNILLILDTSSSMENIVSGTGMSRLDNMKGALRTLISSTNNVNMGLMRFSRAGGPVLYPVSYIDQPLGESAAGQVSARVSQADDDAQQSLLGVMELDSPFVTMTETTTGGNQSVELEILNVTDDVEEKVPSGSLDIGSSDLEIMHEGSSQQLIGLRFTNTSAITPSSTIISAEIEFSDDGDAANNDSDLEVTIQAEREGDTGTFGTGAGQNNVSSRNLTTAASNWFVGNFDANGKLITNDLAAVLNEVISDGVWSEGDPFTFVLQYASGNGSARRVAMSRDRSATNQPKLRITYSTGALAVTQNQTVGLRFQNVGVPKGATITSASLEFVVAQASSNTTSLTISAEDTGNAAAFTNTANNLSIGNRPRTSASESWVPGEWETIGEVVESVDISDVIQEVTSHDDWCGNNAMALFISGTGQRIAESFESNPSSAPVLKINYDPDSVPNNNSCFNREYSYRVENSSDDAEQESGQDVYLVSSDLELSDDGSKLQEIGIRFSGVQIPKNAEIQSAYLEFTADGSSTDSTSLIIYGDDVDDSPTFGASSNTVIGRTKTAASVSWSNVASWDASATYQSPDITAIVQSIVNRNGWSAGNGMSFIITGSGTRRAFSYNGSAGLAPRLVVQAKSDDVTSSTRTVRDELLEIVDGIQYKSGTPIVGTYYEAALYFRGESVDFGRQRGNDGSSRREHTRVSHPDSYMSGVVNRDAGCTDDNLSSTDCRTENISGSPVYISPITESCQKNHIVILTDGQASYNAAEDKVKAMIGSSTCADTGNQACGPELATWLNTVDQAPGGAITGDQTITTHTIGFNFTGDWIKSISENGGGDFYEASTADQLANAFESIVTEALKTNSTFVSPAVAINQFNRLNHLDNIYFAVFKPTEEALWQGNVKKYRLSGTENDITDVNGNLAIDELTGFFKDSSQSYWSSSVDGPDVPLGGVVENLPGHPRNTYTFTGSSLDLTDNSNALHTIAGVYNSGVTKTMLGDATMTDQAREDLLDWITGRDVLDEDNDSSTSDRQSMADPLHSKPIVFTYAGTSASPSLALLFGTNDGHFRAVNATNGQQLWSFIPPELLPVSKTLYENISAQHPYGVDGSPVLWVNDPDFNGTEVDLTGANDFAYVYFGMRRGGRNFYALDVTDINEPKIKWRIEGGVGDFVELGQTWSRPIKTKIGIRSGNTTEEIDVLIFAGGYDPDQDNVNIRTADTQGRAIFIVNAITGNLIWSGGPGGSFTENFADMQYSIPASPAVADLNNDGLADQIYVGDMGGQIWRFDITNGEQLSGLISGGVIADVSVSNDAANTRRFYHSPDLALIKNGAGNLSLTVLIGSGYHAHPLDTQVTDRFYKIDVANPFEAPGSYVKLTETDLYDASDNELGSSDTSTAAAAQATFATKNGWYVTMPNLGEKVLSSPLTIDGQVVFVTYEPKANTSGCTVQPGTSREYVLRVSNATPTIDFNNDGVLNEDDRSETLNTGSIVDEPVMVFTGDGGGTTFLGTEKGSLSIGTDRVIRTFWYQE